MPLIDGKNDSYQSSVTTTYAKDQTTGGLFLTSGTNVRTIIPEMFPSALFIGESNYANNADNNVYIVPTGKKLIVTGLFIQISYQAASYARQANLTLDGAEMLRGYGSDVAGAYAMSVPLTALIVLNAGQEFRIVSDSLLIRAVGGFFGYLLDKDKINF